MSISNDHNKKRPYETHSTSQTETSSNSAHNKTAKVGQERIHLTTGVRETEIHLPPITELPCTPQFFYTNETEQMSSKPSTISFVAHSTLSMAPPQSNLLSFTQSKNFQTSEAIKQITNKAKLDMTALFEEGKYQNAINAFETVKHFSKNRPDLLSIIGDCYMKLENYKEALANYQRASSLIKEIDAEALIYSNKTTQALQAINQLKQTRDNNNKAGYNQSQINNNNNKLMPTKVMPAKEITLKPPQPQFPTSVQRIVLNSHEKDACVHLENGKSLLEKGDISQAKVAFLCGLKFDKASSYTIALLLCNLGFAHLKLEEIKESIAVYKDALVWAKNDDLKAEIIFQYSQVLLKDKQYDLAHETLFNATKTLKNISGDNEGRLLLGIAILLEDMGNSPDARQVLTSALSKTKNPILNQDIIGKIYLNLIDNLSRSGNAEDNAECIYVLGLGLSCNNIDAKLKGFLCLKVAQAQQKFGNNHDAIHTCKLGLGINGIHDEIRSKLLILIGDLALSDVLLMYHQAFTLPGVTSETKAIAENASKKLSDFILSIATNTTIAGNKSRT